MAKQLKMNEAQRVPLNLVQGQFWSRTYNTQDVVKQPNVGKYYELREVQTFDGVSEKLVEVEYPITPDYVKSFANSADYRNDLESALNAPSRGVGLGDVTGLQEVLAKDLSEVRALQDKLKTVESQLLSAQKAPESVSQEKENKGIESEVK